MASFDSAEYLPLELRRHELFDRTTQLLDAVIRDAYTPHLNAALHTFDPKGEGFDAAGLFGMIGGPDLVDLLSESGIPDRTIAHLLPRLFNLKGTGPGVNLLMALVLNEAPNILVGWEVWRGFPASVNPDRSDGPDNVYLDAYNSFASSFPNLVNGITKREDLACRVYIQVGRGGGLASGTEELDRDEQVLNIVRRFLPVCTVPVVQVNNNITAFPNVGNLDDKGPDESYLRISDGVSSGASMSDTGPGETHAVMGDVAGRDAVSFNPLTYSSGRAYSAPGDNEAPVYGDPGGSTAGFAATFQDSLRVVSVTESGTEVPQDQWHIE